MKNEKKQTGRVNYFMVLAGGYLIYLAYKILKSAMLGESSQPVIGVVSAIAFIVVGGLLLRREWKAYKYGQEHIDDPETWSDDPELLEELRAGKEGEEPEVLEDVNEEET